MKHRLLLLLLTFISITAFGQVWQDGGNGLQFRYVGGFREVRQLVKTPQPPFAITDSLKAKGVKQNSLATDGTGVKYPTVDAINAAVNTFSVDDIPALKAYTGNATSIFVKDKYRGGIFNLKNETLLDDDGVIVAATGLGSGYHWVRKTTGNYINVLWFPNIVPDSITDCSPGINAIPLKYTYRFFPGGNYKLNSSINLDYDNTYWSIMGEDVPLKTLSKSTVFIAGFSGDVFTTGGSYSYEGIQFKNFQIHNVQGGYGIFSCWPETRINNVRMLLNYGNGIKLGYLNGSNGAFDCTLIDVKIEGNYTDTPVTFSGTGVFFDKGSNNSILFNSFLFGFYNAVIIKSSENVNLLQNNFNASGGDYAIKVLDTAGTINLNIENNYIESQNRALYVGNARGVSFLKNMVSDATFGGPDSGAHLFFDTNAKSVVLANNTITSTFKDQAFVSSVGNITLQNNNWFRNRPGATFTGVNFDIPEASWQQDTLTTVQLSGTTNEGVNRFNAVKNYLNLKSIAYTNITSDPLGIDSYTDGPGLYYSFTGLNRWIIRPTGTQSGSNSGFNLNFAGRADDGSALGDWMTIRRDNGNLGINNLTPTEKLDIIGKAKVSDAPTDPTGVMRLGDMSVYAPLASPALTGTPTAPTATAGTNTTQIATTAFVQSSMSLGSSGSYTPTITAINNCTVTATNKALYSRNGDNVTVTGRMTVTVTAANTATYLSITFPIPSNIGTGSDDLSGVCTLAPNSSSTPGSGGYIEGDNINDYALVRLVSTSVSGTLQYINYSFTYVVK